MGRLFTGAFPVITFMSVFASRRLWCSKRPLS
jgi:hypothetical protein